MTVSLYVTNWNPGLSQGRVSGSVRGELLNKADSFATGSTVISTKFSGQFVQETREESARYQRGLVLKTELGATLQEHNNHYKDYIHRTGQHRVKCHLFITVRLFML